MASVHNSVETVNAAATAIITAETRVQPSTVQKRRWGSRWSLYWCFGLHKQSKRTGHAVFVSDNVSQNPLDPITENPTRSSTVLLPFIAPPSSPAPFLQSDPHSPSGLLSLNVHTYAQNDPTPMFTIGPYAHETQLVSPPVFSTFTTEPSTASFTPPPEPVHMTTPSSPEVPFAELLSSSLAQNQRKYQPYHYPGSPGGSHVKSPVSISGTSSPLPDRRPVVEFRTDEATKFIGYEHFMSDYKWGSRIGSGSLGVGPTSRVSEVASLANSDHHDDDVVVDHHRVSFELVGEDIPTCVVREARVTSRGANRSDLVSKNDETCGEQQQHIDGETGNNYHHGQRTISLGSSKDFNFNNAKGEISDKLGPQENWSFFPMLQSGVSC